MKRVYWLDLARVVAIMLVVFTHAHEQAGMQSVILKSIYYSIDRLGVPVFLMISGALVLPRISAEASVFAFYKKRIPQFIIILFFYSTFTALIKNSSFNNYSSFDLLDALINNNGIYPAQTSAPQLWYMYVIIGLYLVSPFLSQMLSKMESEKILMFCGLCILLNQIPSTLGSFGYKIDFLYKIGGSMTGAYLVYFLLGYLIIHRNYFDMEKVKGLWVYSFLLISPVVLLALIEYSVGKVNSSLHWYSTSMFILVSSVGIIMVLKILFENKNTESKIIREISSCSFGIFLSHYAFLYITKWFIDSNFPSIMPSYKVVLYFIFPLVISFIFTKIMMKNKITKYFVF